jgi:hypothetical protein
VGLFFGGYLQSPAVTHCSDSTMPPLLKSDSDLPSNSENEDVPEMRRHTKWRASAYSYEVPDFDEESDAEDYFIATERGSQVASSKSSPSIVSRARRRRLSSSDLSSRSDCVAVDSPGSVELASDADDEDDGPLLSSWMQNLGAHPGDAAGIFDDNVPLSDPRSWVWKGREGATIAVVVPRAQRQDRLLGLGTISASKQNAIAGWKSVGLRDDGAWKKERGLAVKAHESRCLSVPFVLVVLCIVLILAPACCL